MGVEDRKGQVLVMALSKQRDRTRDKGEEPLLLQRKRERRVGVASGTLPGQ